MKTWSDFDHEKKNKSLGYSHSASGLILTAPLLRSIFSLFTVFQLERYFQKDHFFNVLQIIKRFEFKLNQVDCETSNLDRKSIRIDVANV